ncbi:MAG: ABC transporter permease [Dysgonamonadaceae bacterium]|nr:ABC transporter permease [Dysgonamonadaceae bacterium]
MGTLKFLIEKEFKQTLRNSIIPKLIIGYPIMVMLIFPWAINFEVKNIKVSVVDHNNSVYSQRLIQKVDASKYFIINNITSSYNEAMIDIEKNHADIILEIQPSFDKNIVKSKRADVMLSANSVNGTRGLLGNAYLSQILNDYSAELRSELAHTGVPSRQKMSFISTIPQYKFNKNLDYKVFMIPALMVMMVTLICGILPALNIVSEKENGTIQQINVTPVNKYQFILAKLIPYWIIGFIILSIAFVVVGLLYGIWPAGGFLPLYVSSLIFIIGISGFGLIISNYSATLQQAMFLAFFFILIIILLSGLFTPIASMPKWAQIVAHSNPLSYFMEIMRMIYLKGSSYSGIAAPLLSLLGFAVGFNMWAVLSYSKSNN